jgi:hypothetical protein
MWLITDQIKSKQCHFDVPRFFASLMCSKSEMAACSCHSSDFMALSVVVVVHGAAWLVQQRWCVLHDGMQQRWHVLLMMVSFIMISTVRGAKGICLKNRHPCFSIILKFLYSSFKQHYSPYDHKGRRCVRGCTAINYPSRLSSCCMMSSLIMRRCDMMVPLHSRACVVFAVPMRCQFGPAWFFSMCNAWHHTWHLMLMFGEHFNNRE